jgi:hypothetical protein
MPQNPQFYDATIIASVAAITALCNGGYLGIYSGSQPALDGAVTGVLLVSLPLSATAFGTPVASGGTVTATSNPISSAPASSTGTAGYMVLTESNGTTIVSTGVCGTTGADLNLSVLSITAGQTVSCSTFTISQLQ